MKTFLTWLGDVLLGPRCPFCGYRGRGDRSLAKHIHHKHKELTP